MKKISVTTEVAAFFGRKRLRAALCQLFFLLAFVFCLLFSSPALAQKSDASLTVRVKDIAEIEGVRGNQLIGYGIVIGLNRTGDRVQQNLYARQTLQNLLERM